MEKEVKVIFHALSLLICGDCIMIKAQWLVACCGFSSMCQGGSAWRESFRGVGAPGHAGAAICVEQVNLQRWTHLESVEYVMGYCTGLYFDSI